MRYRCSRLQASRSRRISASIVYLSRLRLAVAIMLVLSASTSCGPKAIRGGEGTGNTRLDARALSVGLDREDLDYLVKQNLDALYAARFWTREVEGASAPPLMAIWPIQNDTSQHLDDQMLTLLTSIETSLINTGDVRMVNRSRHEELAREVGIQKGAAYDPTTGGQLGRQLGVKYFLTGKITSVDERLRKIRRLQYSLFVQVLEIETGLIKFQNEATRSKALQR